MHQIVGAAISDTLHDDALEAVRRWVARRG